MDPESNIRDQLMVAEDINMIRDRIANQPMGPTLAQLVILADRAMTLATLVQALNAYLMRGGFYPAAWGTRCVDTNKHVKMRP